MKKTAIVTAYYVTLHGTKFGGRNPPRTHQYQNSFSSLAKMNDADFFIFCGPESEEEIQYLKEKHPDVNITIIPFDLENFYMKDLFGQYKNIQEAIEGNRCQELQYCKTLWMKQISGQYEYENIFWFDMGISYSALIPDKYLILKEGQQFEYYDSSLMCNDLLNGLIKHSGEKITFLLIANCDTLIYRKHLDLKYFPKGYEHRWHVIAGIFGGKREHIDWLHDTFVKEAEYFINDSQSVEDEEVIYNIMCYKYADRFSPTYFQIWHHEDNNHPWTQGDSLEAQIYRNAKPFYHILEDFIKLGKQ